MLARKGYGSGLAFAVVKDELAARVARRSTTDRPARQNAPRGDEREILTYELFGTAVRELAQQVVDNGYEPDLVLSIARGGLGLGMGLGYALDVKNLSAVNVEFYTGVDERLDVPIMLPPTPAAVDLAGLKVLIADDVADTGKTLEIVRDVLRRPRRRGADGGDLREAVDRGARPTTSGATPRPGSTSRGRRSRRWSTGRGE